MPHLSDGELHAYLDGALDHLPETRGEEIRDHLRTCGACRSRVAEERELLERSTAILEAGGPGEVESPPLEELRERARIREERAARQSGRGLRSMPRSQAMAWAATVVLALGIGWMSRDVTGVRSPLRGPALQSTSVEAPQGEAAPAESPDRDVVEDEGAAVTPAGDSGADRFLDRSPPPEASAEPPAEEPIEEAAEDRGAAEPSMGATVVGRVVDGASLEPLPGAAVVLEDSAGVRHGGTLTQSDGRFLLRAERPGTYRAVVELIGHAGASTDFFELSPDETVARDISTPAQALSLDAITVTGVRAEEMEAAEGVAPRMAPGSAAAPAEVVGEGARNRWLLSSDTYGRAAGAPDLASSHVPGLPVVRVDPQTEPSGFVIVQRLANGDTLRLRWIADAAPGSDEVVDRRPILEPLPEAWSEVVLRWGNGWLVARAPLDEEELRALLARGR